MKEGHAAPEEAQLLGDAIAFQRDQVRVALDQLEEEALRGGRGLEDQAVVGVIAEGHHGALGGGLHQHVRDGQQLRGGGAVAAGVAGEVQQHVGLAGMRGQRGPEALHVEAALGVVEGEGLEFALQPHLEDGFVVVPIEIRQDQRFPRCEEQVRSQAQGVADARGHLAQGHPFHAGILRHELPVPGLAGTVPALDGRVEERIGGVQMGHLFGHGGQGQGFARAIRDLADGGVDAAVLGLARLEGDALGEEGPAPQGRQGFQDHGADRLQAFVAFQGFGVEAHGRSFERESPRRGRWV
ncbi:MAG: hypothetical protein BWY56_01189 [Acidobacteria bacterium ADurb.Bin340]|nr:MAG: hypothetical protein BWY56_01189 [Acidobacteria bacterium ADurb.Bin340]